MKHLLKPTYSQLEKAAVDITSPKAVEVSYSKDGVFWVNVDGICLLRICRPDYLQIVDPEGVVRMNMGKISPDEQQPY